MAATDQRLTAPIYASASVLRQYAAPTTDRRYAYVVSLGLFYWSPSSTATDDSATIITPAGAASGRWLIADSVLSVAVAAQIADHEARLDEIALGGGVSQTVHTADGALVIGRINVLTSAADAMTLPDATTNAGRSLVVINDMATTDATVTRSGSDTISGGSTSTTFVLTAGAPGIVTFVASSVSAKWYAVARLT